MPIAPFMTRRPLASGRIELFLARTKNYSPDTFLANSTPTSVSGVGNFPQRAKGPLRRRTCCWSGLAGKPRIRAPTEGTSDRRYQPNRRVSNSSLGKLMCRRYDTGASVKATNSLMRQSAAICGGVTIQGSQCRWLFQCVAKFEKNPPF